MPNKKTEEPKKPEEATAEAQAAKKPTPKVYYYWFKTNVYVSETEHLTRGLYTFDHELERVKNLPAHEMEVYEGELPERVLYKIAEWAGVTVDIYEGNKRTTKSDAELLEVLLKN